jgi:hypothetical protein
MFATNLEDRLYCPPATLGQYAPRRVANGELLRIARYAHGRPLLQKEGSSGRVSDLVEKC